MRGRPKGSSKGNLIRYLNEDQLKRLFSVIDQGRTRFRDGLMYRLILFFALRVREAQGIRLADIVRDTHQISIKGIKSGRQRVYDVPDDIWKKIDSWMKRRKPKENPFLFPNQIRENLPIDVNTIKLGFKKYLRLAGLPVSFSVHSLRHTCAIQMAKAGASPIRIQMWLRQRSILSAQRYFEAVSFEGDEKRVARIFEDIL